MTPAWVSDTTGKDALTPVGLGPWALLCSSSVIPRSVILRRLFEPALQVSLRDIWNVGGRGLGIFALKGFRFWL